ncbi:SET domain-containing protein 4 [Melipona quadrifasciata]|uniref:SET domain-containing protein 4 n=1 Tax=Melipona quadrifasciata TaxID=166423 RepID=A0A0N0U6U2_9HYME|nr:SET domain-containing protein 4 [Melipona quadrifasciata]
MGRTSRKRHQKKKLNIKEITENEEHSLMYLKSWLLTKNCSSVYNLTPFNFFTTGRGLKTLKDIKINDILIKLPYEILITTSILSQSNVSILFSKIQYYSAQCVLAVFIIYESHLGNASKWHYYINSLPRNLTNPDFCTQKEKNLLPKFIIDYMDEFHKVCNDFRLLIKSMNNLKLNGEGHCSHCNLHLKKIITFEKYKWAYYIVNTRAIYIDEAEIETNQNINIKYPNNLALAPFLDLFNHSIYSTTHASVVTNKNGNKFYQINTLNSFNSESQVFINYGAHNSLKLYIHYGFFIPYNPLDEIYFDISDIKVCFDIPKFKLDFIISNNLQKNMAFIRDGLNYNAICTLFIMNTQLQRDHWNIKIYGNSLTSEDKIGIYNMAKLILNFKKNELLNHLINMKELKYCTQCFSIAINLIEEYITILNESYNSLCMFH